MSSKACTTKKTLLRFSIAKVQVTNISISFFLLFFAVPVCRVAGQSIGGALVQPLLASRWAGTFKVEAVSVARHVG